MIVAGVATQLPYKAFVKKIEAKATGGAKSGSNQDSTAGDYIVNSWADTGSMFGSSYNAAVAEYTDDSVYNRIARHAVENEAAWNAIRDNNLKVRSKSIFWQIANHFDALNRNGFTSTGYFSDWDANYLLDFWYWDMALGKARHYDGVTTYTDYFIVPSINLSGGTISDIASTSTDAGIRVSSDGKVYKNIHAVWTQINASTDWIISNIDADSTYEVRITNVSWTSGTSFTYAAAANDTWIAITTDRDWYIRDTTAGLGGDKEVTFDLQIRKDGGAVLASASYTLISKRT